MDTKHFEKLGYSSGVAVELAQLYSMKFLTDGVSMGKKKAIRQSLRNAGILSLPFSMNRKK